MPGEEKKTPLIRINDGHFKEKALLIVLILVAAYLSLYGNITCRFLKALNYFDRYDPDHHGSFYLGMYRFDDDQSNTCRPLGLMEEDTQAVPDDILGWPMRLARSFGIIAAFFALVLSTIATLCLGVLEINNCSWRLFQIILFLSTPVNAGMFTLFWDDTCYDPDPEPIPTMDDVFSQQGNSGDDDQGSYRVECMVDKGGIMILSACLIYNFAFLQSFAIPRPVQPMFFVRGCERKKDSEGSAVLLIRSFLGSNRS